MEEEAEIARLIESLTSDAAEAARRIEEMIAKLYDSLEEVEIPHTIAEAAESGWFLAFDAVNLGTKLHYEPAQRAEDRTRVIPTG